jgi:hypothetical protein
MLNQISGNQSKNPPMSIGLGAGQVYLLPSGQGVVGTFGGTSQQFTGFTLTGQYLVNLGPFTNLQMYDAVLQTWRNVTPANGVPITISSDGTNYRLANTTGAAVAALVTAGGTGLTNGFNTVTATQSAGGGTWNTIVGGAINPTLQIVAAGTLYTQRPIVIFNPPSTQGTTPFILPTAVAAITGGLISTVTVTNVGAGLVANPTITILNAPGDTTGSGGSLAATAALVGSGTLTALYTTGNFGTVGLTAVPTFTFAPASTITATAIMNFTITNVSVTAAGAGYGNAQPVGILCSGGQVAGSAAAGILTGNPYFDKSIVFPRAAAIEATSIASGAVGTAGQLLVTTIHDAGFGFQKVPNLFPVAGGNAVAVTTQAQLAAIVGGQNDVSVIQSL